MKKRIINKVSGYSFGEFEGETEADCWNAWAKQLGYENFSRYLRDPALLGKRPDHLKMEDA